MNQNLKDCSKKLLNKKPEHVVPVFLLGFASFEAVDTFEVACISWCEGE